VNGGSQVFDGGGSTNFNINLAQHRLERQRRELQVQGREQRLDPYQIVIIKARLLKAVCKALSPVPTVSFRQCRRHPRRRYRQLLHGVPGKKNTDKPVKILSAPPPSRARS